MYLNIMLVIVIGMLPSFAVITLAIFRNTTAIFPWQYPVDP